MSTTETNRELLRRCYESYFVHGSLDAVADAVHEDFVQHSPDAPSGRQAYLAHLAEAAFKGGTSDVKRILADGDFVAVHHHLRLRDDNGPGLAVVDLWRVQDGKLIEHWDVEQPVPDSQRVPNGMF
ncbi:nuclear transport factor 2 family protein [Dactylosporangium sp. CA-139114]|uniref:nuclear transport factor 2 family protein n=1 Tax=Dactylosporangium sp. CA-139114 TaxID=3239931 RepID=UPI003D98F61B